MGTISPARVSLSSPVRAVVPFANMVQPLKFRNGWVISSHTLLGMWLLIHAGIKVKPR